ncbi:UNKNOWN [Stylonychia lemnae]|uniref:Transmembrane protein n=1 Tax=Stylonychia lemnae TaxID=5949 RepID=A0A078A7T9_STYLE|nr:UNKNOWN [Stylonychia lemnae]|eukprot:CDW77901.1 UNKNOWN [Stylonychia lemnae]
MEQVALLADEQNRKDIKKINSLKTINIVFLVLSVLALIYELTVFSYYLWYMDVLIGVQVVFAVSNLGFIISHEDTQQFWLTYRKYFIYGPFVVMVIVTIVLLGLVAYQLFQSDEFDKNDQNYKLYATLALLFPIVPILGQGISYVILISQMYEFNLRIHRFLLFESVKQSADNSTLVTTDEQDLNDEADQEQNNYRYERISSNRSNAYQLSGDRRLSTGSTTNPGIN